MPNLGFGASLPQTIEGERESRKKMTRLRKVVAKRLVEAQQNAAMLTTFNEIDMSHVMDLRKKYKERFKETHGVGLGFMSFFVKATVEALKFCPAINAFIDGDDIVSRHYFDVSIAVSTPKGLVVPVVKDCDKLSFNQVESSILDFALRGRDGKLTTEDMQGGGFTITNGGTFGSLLSTPILNPPQSAILGMHKIEQRAVVVDGEIVIRPMMYVALSYDHRIVDGKEAVTFLVKIKECIEDPAKIMLEL
jgi:2-oxoglutarate dehydrogenase E2 component (dihydrolipoamide succinyltransferase)